MLHGYFVLFETICLCTDAGSSDKILCCVQEVDLNSERDYFQNIKSQTPTSASSNLFLNGSFQSILSDSALYNADYLINFQHTVSGKPQQAKGNAQFFLAPDRNNYWAIYQWIDARIGNEVSWSELKGTFSN